MTGFPTVKVSVDDGTGTYPIDITTRVRIPEGINGERGRQAELDQVTPAKVTFVGDNADGALTPGSTLLATPSPIKADQLVRITYQVGATTVNRYTGNLLGAPVSWPGGGDEFSLVKASLIDPQAQFERRPLRSIVEEEWLKDTPDALWLMREPAGATACADFSGNNRPSLAVVGSSGSILLGQSGIVPTSGYSAATFAGSRYLAVTDRTYAVNIFCEEIVFQRAGAVATDEAVLTDVSTGAFGLFSASVTMNTAGKLVYGAFTSAAAYNDGLPHHLFVRLGDLYVDGVLLGSSIYSPVYGLPMLTGSTACRAVYSHDVTPTRIAAHAAAALTGFAGESGTARITRIAGYPTPAVPLGTVDTSLSNVAFEPIDGKYASGVANEVASAEFGIAYFNGSGSLDFHNRNRVPLKTTPDITIDANFLDPGTQFEYDMQGVLNYYEVTAAGTSVTQLARNTTSEITNKHGRYPGSATYLVQTDAEALDRGNWIVNTKGEPVQRVDSLVIDVLTMDAATQALMLAVEPDTWIRITGLPANTPGGTTADFIVEGWTEALGGLGDSAKWELRCNVVSRTFFAAWVLDDATYSVLGSTTKLYF